MTLDIHFGYDEEGNAVSIPLFQTFFDATTGHGKTVGMKTMLWRFHQAHPDWKILIIDSKDIRDYADLKADIPICFVETTEPLDLKNLLEPMVGCYDPETEILTEDGWKNYTELMMQDRFCTLNPETNDIEFQFPERVFWFHYKGKMYRAKSRQVDLLVTPNHRLFVAKRRSLIPGQRGKFDFYTPKEIFGKHIFYKKNGVWNCSQMATFALPEVARSPSAYRMSGSYPINRQIPLDDWLKIFGFWLAEGSASKIRVFHPRKHYYYWKYLVSWANKKNPQLLLEITGLLRKAGFSVQQNGYNIFVQSKQLWAYLKQFGKAWEKFIPKEIKALGPAHLRVLLEYYAKGDGHFRDSGLLHACWTTSPRLRDDLQEIALKIGYSATYSKSNEKGDVLTINGKTVTARHDCWVISFNYKQNLPRFYAKRARREGYNLIEEWQDYDGSVWCVTVPNGLVYVRRNGTPVWSGNSSMMYYLDQIIEESVYDTLGEMQQSINKKIVGAESGQIKIPAKTLGKLRVINHLLKKLVTLVDRPEITSELELHPGFNVMPVALPGVPGRLKRAFQSLIVRSVCLKLTEPEFTKVLVVLDEIHKWCPQRWASICKQPIGEGVAEGRGKEVFYWMADQALAKVDKEPLKPVKVWIVGQQMSRHEVKYAMETVNDMTELTVDKKDIKKLAVGFFVVVDGVRHTVTKAYLQPYGVSDELAMAIATGKRDPLEAEPLIHGFNFHVKKEEDDLVYKEKYEEEKRLREETEKEFARQVERLSDLKANEKIKDLETRILKLGEGNKILVDEVEQLRLENKDLESFKQVGEDADNLREAFLKFLRLDAVAKAPGFEPGPSEVNVKAEQPTLTVETLREPLTLVQGDLLGRIAIVYAEGQLPQDKWFTVTDVTQAFIKHGWKKDPRTSVKLDQLCEWGYFEKHFAGRRPEYRLKMKPEEAREKGLLKVEEK